MKTFKKITSILMMLMFVMSFGIYAYADISSADEFGIIEANGTSKSVYVEFNTPVKLADDNSNFTVTDDGGNDIPIAELVLSEDKKIVNIIFENPINVQASETKKVNINVSKIESADGKYVYLGGTASVTYKGIWLDTFDNYTSIAELDTNYVLLNDYNWATLKYENNPGTFSFVEDPEGGQKLKITSFPNSWGMLQRYCDGWSMSKKNYTVEIDLESNPNDATRIRFFTNNYNMGYIPITVAFKKDTIEFSRTRPIMVEDGTDTARPPVSITSDEKYTVALSMKKAYDNTADIFDIYYNAKNAVHAKGTVSLSGTGHGLYHFVNFDYTSALMDNFRLYETTSLIDNSVAKKIELAEINPVIMGEFDEGLTIECTHLQPDVYGFTSAYSYKWYKTDDATKDISQWTLVANDNAEPNKFTLTTDNCDFTKDSFLCEVTRVISEIGGSYSKEIKYYSPSVCKPWSPVCKDVSFSYTKGDTSAKLEAIPEYFDINRDAEDKASATFVWEISNDNNAWSAFSGSKENNNGYNENVIDVTDITDKYIRCTVSLKALTGINDTLNAEPMTKSYKLPFKPVASEVRITGGNTVGSVLKAIYTYYDENGDSENTDKSELVWYKKTSGGDVQIGTGVVYSISASDAGYEIILKVTPKNDVYPEAGLTVESSNTVTVASYVNGGNGSTYVPSYESKVTVSSKPTTTPGFTPVPEEKEPAFADIKGHWAQKSIEALNEKGLINGRENGFEPDAPITRAEWITLLLRAINADTEKVQYKNTFSDVSKDGWYANSVLFAYENGLVNGNDGQFNPDENVTREQMAKMLIDVFEYYTKNTVETAELNFNDKDNISEWALEYVEKAVSQGLINGTPENNFNPYSQATRAEASTVLLRLLTAIGE